MFATETRRRQKNISPCLSVSVAKALRPLIFRIIDLQLKSKRGPAKTKHFPYFMLQIAPVRKMKSIRIVDGKKKGGWFHFYLRGIIYF